MSKPEKYIPFKIDPKTIKSPQIKRRQKTIFDEMQDAFEIEQAKGKGYEPDEYIHSNLNPSVKT